MICCPYENIVNFSPTSRIHFCSKNALFKPMGNITPETRLSFPLGHVNPVIHPSLDRPHSPPQTASGSNQPFCDNTFSGLTDRQTDRQMGKATIVYQERLCSRSKDSDRHAKNLLNKSKTGLTDYTST